MSDLVAQRQRELIWFAIRDKAVERTDVELLMYCGQLMGWLNHDGWPDRMPRFDTGAHYQRWQRYKQMHVHIG